MSQSCVLETLQAIKFKLFHVYSHLDGFNFITGYTEDEPFWKAGNIFVIPFQFQVWIAMGAAVVATFVIFVASKCVIPLRFDILSNLASILYNLLEVGLSDKQSNAIKSRFMLKLVFGVWVLTGLVLTNAYKGIIISFLCAPFKSVRVMKYFSELDNFTHYTPSISTPLNDLNLCTPHLFVCASPDWKIWNNYTSKKLSYEDCNTINLRQSYFGQLLLSLKKALWTDKQRLLHNKIENSTFVFHTCKFENLIHRLKNVKKSAYVTWNTELDSFLRILQKETKAKSDKIFYKGQDLIYQFPRNWYVSNIPHSLPYFRLSKLISSGIYQHLKFWLQDITKFGVEETNEDATPLSTSHNLFFIFYVLIFGCVVSIMSFAVELFKILFHRPSRRVSNLIVINRISEAIFASSLRLTTS